MGRGLRIGHPVGGTDPYPLYPTLDRNLIPFHFAAGASPSVGGYGAQTLLQAPTLPTFGDQVTLSSGDIGFNPPAGRRYVVGANLGDIVIAGTIADIELVIPAAYSIGKLTIAGEVHRLCVRGSTLGTHSGGQISGISIDDGIGGPFPIEDIVIDGLKVSTPTDIAPDALCLSTSDIIDRMFVGHCKFRAAQAMFTGSANHLVWAGNSMEAGAYSSGQCPGGIFPPTQQWTMRHGGFGPIVVFDNDIRGRRFGRFRAATSDEAGSDKLIWIDSNLIMSDQEGNAASCGILLGSTPWRGAWVTNNDVYGYGGAKLDMERAIYARVTGNNIYNDNIDAAFMATQAANHASWAAGASLAVDVDYTTGNAYNAYPGRPAWTRQGNPSSDVVLAGGSILDSGVHTSDLAGYVA